MNLNRIIFLIVFGCSAIDTIKAQTADIIFNYDEAGNLIQRKIQVMPGARIGKFNTPIDSSRVFKVYPNPSNSFVRIEGPLPEGTSQGEMSLLSITGQVLKTDVYTGQTKTLMVSDLKPGLYVLEIKYSKTQKSTYKIIVSN